MTGLRPGDWINHAHLAPDHGGPVTRPCKFMPHPAAMAPLCDALQATAVAQPERLAIESADGTTLTFRDLWAAVEHQAARIKALDAPPGPVSVLVPNGPIYVVAVFACLAAGRLAVLMDTSAPVARNADLHAAVGGVLTLGGAPFANGLLRLELELGAGPAEPPQSRLGLDDAAFIIPTSGSTGRPKSIVHSQRTMFHWVRTIHNALHLQPQDRVLSLSSPSTLGGLTALLSIPLSGGCLQMLDVKSAGLATLMDTLSSRPVTILRAAPSMLRGLTRLPDAADAFANLRVVQTFGEPLMKEDVVAFRRVLPPGCLVRTTYGSTECSGLSWFVSQEDLAEGPHTPTGLLMPDTEAVLLDDYGGPCGPGQEGELLIRSSYNALGEWEGGALTPGRLLPDPAEPSRRLYHTGDLATVNSQGVFTIIGRKDRMVKINGQRLEPAEIERVLLGEAGVAQAAVVVDHSASSPRVIAFVSPAGAPRDLAASLAARLRVELPAFMVPTRILPVDEIPRLPSGKVDSVALLLLSQTRSVQSLPCDVGRPV